MILKYIYISFIVVALISGCASSPRAEYEARLQLFTEIRAKNLDKVKEIVEAGNVDLDPPTQPNQINKALAYASINGNLEIVKYILAQGVEIDGVVSYGGTALLRASEVLNFDIAEFLIKSGANVNHPNSFGISAMVGYAITCNPKLIDLALEHGGDLNRAHTMTTSTSYGQKAYNPIQWAVVKENTECVKHLIKKGARLNVMTTRNESLLDLAKRKDNVEIIQLIEKNKQS